MINISKGDVQKYGVSPACTGCRNVMKGWAQRPHTKECIEMMEKFLVNDGDPRITEYEKKLAYIMERTMEGNDNSKEEEG